LRKIHTFGIERPPSGIKRKRCGKSGRIILKLETEGMRIQWKSTIAGYGLVARL